MKELYCDKCKEETTHAKYKEIYYCVICRSSNYLKEEIDNPEGFKLEMQKLKELERKLIVETGFPF